MKVFDILTGMKVNVMTDMKVLVELEIKQIVEKNNSRDLEPATRENDWWPKSEDWTTFEVTFTNGVTKSYSSLSEIDIVEDTE